MVKGSIPDNSGDETLEPLIYTRDTHKISPRDIDEDAMKVIARLRRAGFKAFIVGGGVRDLLLSRKPKDFDVATDATPRQIKDLFRNSRAIGRRFKLVHVYFRGPKIIEVSTFRDRSEWISEEEDGPVRVDNTFGDERTDALRRDLTINALFLDTNNLSIIDYIGGIKDFDNELVRVIGDPTASFKEDPVRLIRVVRHAARCGFAIEDETWKSLLKNRKLITTAAPVRVYEEIKKDLCSGWAWEILELLGDSGLLTELLPDQKATFKTLLAPGSCLETMMRRIDTARRQRGDMAPTYPLAAIAFCTKSPDEKTLLCEERFQSLDEVDEHLSTCFDGMSVPKREKERIYNLLSYWFLLSSDQRLYHRRRSQEVKDSLEAFIGIIESGDQVHIKGEASIGKSTRRRKRRRSKSKNTSTSDTI